MPIWTAARFFRLLLTCISFMNTKTGFSGIFYSTYESTPANSVACDSKKMIRMFDTHAFRASTPQRISSAQRHVWRDTWGKTPLLSLVLLGNFSHPQPRPEFTLGTAMARRIRANSYRTREHVITDAERFRSDTAMPSGDFIRRRK